jgi:TetR/AcrR family transcriptional regulator, regulator of cefoperazone and chloramphenicol sensitivity
MVNPSAALETLVAERIRPMAELLYGILSELLGPEASPEEVRLCGFSIMSQCVFHAHCRSVVEELYPEQHFRLKDVERLAEHIVRFSLAGLKQVASGLARPPLTLRRSGDPLGASDRAGAASCSVCRTCRPR